MIRLSPREDLKIPCPICQKDVEVHAITIPGMRCLADTTCSHCERAFFQDLPVSHALLYPTSIDQKTEELFYKGLDWYPLLLQKTVASKKQATSPTISIEGEKLNTRAIVLNCLDTYYGHSLLKLLNAQYYLDTYPDHDLIVIVPSFLRWMIPAEVERAMTVSIPLREGYLWMENLDKMIKDIETEYEETWLSPAYSHPHPSQVTIERFIPGIVPFSRDELTKRPLQATFITREDRLWIASETLSKILAKFGSYWPISWFKQLCIWYQNRKITSLARQLKKAVPDLTFKVIGLATSGSFPSWIKDSRAKKIDEKMERLWCEEYAKSTLIIGIHGSNMLLPSAFGGMILNILPKFKFGNAIQDLLIQESDSRVALFRYRLLPITLSTSTIASIAISQLRGIGKFLKNNIENTHLSD